MNKILHVAIRDFLATAGTKAFVIGAFVVPIVLAGILVLGFKFLFKAETPKVVGSVAILDATGRVADDVGRRLSRETLAQRRSEEIREIGDKLDAGDGPIGESVRERVEAEMGRVPEITVEVVPPSADVEAEKEPLRTEEKDGGRLALAIVEATAVDPPPPGASYGSFELFVREGLDDRVESDIRGALHDSVRDRRISAAGHDPEVIDALITVDAPETREITAEGERESLGELRMFVPFGFMILLMMSVMIGGQYLLTTTVEEKSSRVVEVLLSALSPMQLMTGKILGQLAVGLSILLIYGAVGGGALLLFGLTDLLGVVNVIYLVVFFLIAYTTVGAMMAAVGSAVNEIREAQSLQGPVMVTMFIPYMLWLPISRDPNSVFATICSFLPPIGPFVMMLRVTSTEPPPTWQVLLSIAVGCVGVWVAIWAAAKVFRIGLLMFGKPPNLMTLLRWVRMA